MDEDDFDFSDAEFDDLPPDTLHHLEANALRATQHQALAAPESDYGLDDGDEVVNLDNEDDATIAHAYKPAAPQYAQVQRGDDSYTHDDDGEEALHHQDEMQVDEQPYRSQADPTQLLSRIKKVGYDTTKTNRGSADIRS